VLHHAEFIADVLNRQLVPAIVRANYGRVEGLEMPELRCKLPKTQANIELAQAWQAVLQIPGMKVKKSEVYESLGVTAPEEGEDVFEAPAQDAGHGGMPGMEAMAEESPALPEEESAEEIQTAKKKIDPAQAWLEPLKKQLREARANGASLAEIREQVRSWKPDTKALAGAFAENIERGLMEE
jgi:phage gp29-like protein